MVGLPIKARNTGNSQRYTIFSCRHQGDGCLTTAYLGELLAQPSLQSSWAQVTGTSLTVTNTATDGNKDSLSVQDIASMSAAQVLKCMGQADSLTFAFLSPFSNLCLCHCWHCAARLYRLLSHQCARR